MIWNMLDCGRLLFFSVNQNHLKAKVSWIVLYKMYVLVSIRNPRWSTKILCGHTMVWVCQCCSLPLYKHHPSVSTMVIYNNFCSRWLILPQFWPKDIQFNLSMWSPLLNSCLHWKITFFLFCNRKFHINWTSFKW
jgi:hypothetical protein